jgi:hypothetical protein
MVGMFLVGTVFAHMSLVYVVLRLVAWCMSLSVATWAFVGHSYMLVYWAADMQGKLNGWNESAGFVVRTVVRC